MTFEELLISVLGVGSSWVIEVGDDRWEGKVWTKTGRLVKAWARLGEVELSDLDALKFLLKKSSTIKRVYLRPVKEEVENTLSLESMDLFNLINQVGLEKEVKKRVQGVMDGFFKEERIRLIELPPGEEPELAEVSKLLKRALDGSGCHYALIRHEKVFTLFLKGERELLVVLSKEELANFELEKDKIVKGLTEALKD